MGFTPEKAKSKPSPTPQQKKTGLYWTKKKQSWTVDDWMEVIVTVESYCAS